MNPEKRERERARSRRSFDLYRSSPSFALPGQIHHVFPVMSSQMFLFRRGSKLVE